MINSKTFTQETACNFQLWKTEDEDDPNWQVIDRSNDITNKLPSISSHTSNKLPDQTKLNALLHLSEFDTLEIRELQWINLIIFN